MCVCTISYVQIGGLDESYYQVATAWSVDELLESMFVF